ncbi:MAG: AI-2E family transporter [Alphaproteobacteria bacterium]|nr:AI-2E family transporter [Alphaproteobacteria bacterium]
MTRWTWIIATGLLVLFVYLTRGVMLPFLAGLAVAYFLDPVTDKLEERKIPRGVAAALVITLFFLIIVGVVLAFWPVLQAQIVAASKTLPETLARLRPWLNEFVQSLSDQFGSGVGSDVDSLLASFSAEIFAKVKAMAGGAVQSGLALFNVLSLLLISPVVAFYLLRDWDLLVAKVDSWLPPTNGPVVRQLMSKIDTVLAGFVRGQLMVSTCMGILYGIGWSFVGLDFAVVLGVLAGVMSIVPFVGALFAAAVAVAIGIGQWGVDPQHIAMVVGVFMVVQLIEGAVLTPKLIGDRVGLHPVWVLFAVFAGGEVMGFVGVLIAVPAAAAIAVLVRYWIDVYLEHYEITPATGPDVEMVARSVESSKESEENGETGKTDTA